MARGGTGDGHLAAEAVVRQVSNRCDAMNRAADWQAELQAVDFRIGTGESTAVIVDVRPDGLCGASVGDSQAWIISDGEVFDLTARQVRKPLLGSGHAQSTGFSHGPLEGLLLVATDGFCNYVKRQDLPRLLAAVPFPEIPRKCVELARLPSGDHWDDIGIVVCRVLRPQRSRERYAI
jgi:serine/threonine protein phosphatase PrpC